MPWRLSKLVSLYNYAEVAIWPTLGLVLAVSGFWQTGRTRKRFLLAAVVLLIFGASDFAEANTNNEWWRPWWLLLWKATCVICLLAILIDAYQCQRAARRTKEMPP